MSRRVTPPSQSPVEKFSDDENTILEPALRSIRYEGKNAIKQCMLCDAEGKYHELQSPNARQVVQHLLLHNIHREYMGVQIKEFFEAAKQQALIQKQIWLENFVKHLILKNQSFNQTDSPYFSKVTTYQVSNQKVKDKLDEMAQNALDNMFSCYNGRKTYATLVQDAYSYQGQHLQAFMLKTEQKTHFLGIEFTPERQDAFWLASQMKEIIEDLETRFNIFVVAIACDSASCGIKAHQLLNGLVKNLEFEQIRNTQLASSTHPVLLRCAAHVGNLFLQDYCRDWNVWSQIQSIAVKHNVRAVMCATRWTSCLNAAKKIKKWIPPGSNLAIDVEIVRLATKYIQFVEADRADAYVLFQQMNQLKTELIRLNNERSRSMLANIEAREQKYHTTHDKIGQFLLSLDPQNPNTDYETFRTLCEQMASKFSKDQLKGNNPVQFYEQLISIEKAEQAVEYLRTSPNGKTDYIDYLFNIWHTNPVIRDTLSIIRALTINSASLERLFSFFHRQTASFLRGSINKETLIKMGIIYTEIMQPEIQRWKQQQLINKLIDKRKGISISEQLMHWNEF